MKPTTKKYVGVVIGTVQVKFLYKGETRVATLEASADCTITETNNHVAIGLKKHTSYRYTNPTVFGDLLNETAHRIFPNLVDGDSVGYSVQQNTFIATKEDR